MNKKEINEIKKTAIRNGKISRLLGPSKMPTHEFNDNNGFSATGLIVGALIGGFIGSLLFFFVGALLFGAIGAYIVGKWNRTDHQSVNLKGGLLRRSPVNNEKLEVLNDKCTQIVSVVFLDKIVGFTNQNNSLTMRFVDGTVLTVFTTSEVGKDLVDYLTAAGSC